MNILRGDNLNRDTRDTIVALSSPPGIGAIAIIRISGNKSLELTEKTIKNKKINIKTLEERRINHGYFYDENGEIIDEIMFVYFKSPRSYTGEDMVEIYCHGGILVTNKIIDTLLKLGARLAENGEFTRRAFLNGKIDLIKAESIIQIIEAKSEKSLKLALDNLKGKLSNEIEYLRSSLINVLSKIEVSIDYGDDIDVPKEEILNDLINVQSFLKEKIKHADKGLHISTGVTMAIVGKPNVGKSTLLNRLLVEDRAIVTDIPGTTRDVIKGELKIKGVHFIISDTAGIRMTEDKVEKIGIEKALNEAKKSDVILFLLDATTGFTNEDEYVYNLIKDCNFIPVWNKIDIAEKVDKDIVFLRNSVVISAETGRGMRELEEKILESVKVLVEDGELSHVTSKRQLEYLKRVEYNIIKAINALKKNMPLDIISIDIRNGLEQLDELMGRNFTEDLLDNIFSNFCVGK